jgi:hypothetical protein
VHVHKRLALERGDCRVIDKIAGLKNYFTGNPSSRHVVCHVTAAVSRLRGDAVLPGTVLND